MSSHKVTSSHMMAFHTILRTSKDYYMALSRARELTDSVMKVRNAYNACNAAFFYEMLSLRTFITWISFRGARTYRLSYETYADLI